MDHTIAKDKTPSYTGMPGGELTMLNIGQALSKNCQGISRRELLQVGGLGLLGFSLADWLRAEDSSRTNRRRRSSETSCIFIFLEGGPSQLETFDPKPQAPNDVADLMGPFPPAFQEP